MANETKHTPGPWTIEVQRAVMNNSRVGLKIVAPTRQWGVAVVQELPGERCDANARLIAAAPDLLATLEMVGTAPIAPIAKRMERKSQSPLTFIGKAQHSIARIAGSKSSRPTVILTTTATATAAEAPNESIR